MSSNPTPGDVAARVTYLWLHASCSPNSVDREILNRLEVISFEYASHLEDYTLDVIGLPVAYWSNLSADRCLICLCRSKHVGIMHGDTVHTGACEDCAQRLVSLCKRMDITPNCPFCEEPAEGVSGEVLEPGAVTMRGDRFTQPPRDLTQLIFTGRNHWL